MAPGWERGTGGTGGGFAALEALLRRVAGVSRLYWCNSPRLLAVRSRFEVRGAQSADHLGDKRQQWGVAGEVVCDLGTTAPGLAWSSHANP